MLGSCGAHGSWPLVVPKDSRVDDEPIKKLTQEEELLVVPVREVDMSCEVGALGNDFD